VLTRGALIEQRAKAERFFDSMAAVPQERDEKKQAAIPLRMTPRVKWRQCGAAFAYQEEKPHP
jgi:hypothetical protein